jgi:hypothetical protein
MSSVDEEKLSSSETSEDEDEDETCSPAPKRAASDAVPKSSGKKMVAHTSIWCEAPFTEGVTGIA